MIAALFVATGGVYFGVDDIDPWDEIRDARLYAGPHSVIAHPPCARWGRYWSGGPSASWRRTLGDDGGCFAASIASVRRWGGVLEHPEASHAWSRYDVTKPPRTGGWIRADFEHHPAGIAWTCCVEQGHFGHRARKATWLYAVGDRPPPLLRWGKSAATMRPDGGFPSTEARRRAMKTGACQLMSKRERAATPAAFRDVLIGLVRAMCEVEGEARQPVAL